MESVWRYILGTIVATVIGGYILAYIQSPESPTIVAKAEWIDISTSAFRRNFGKEEAAIDPTAATERAWFKYSSTLRVLNLFIRNDANFKSKEIEITAGDGELVFLAIADGVQQPSISRALIKSLDPSSSTKLTIVTPTWSPYAESPLLVMHDGRKVEISLVAVPQELEWLVELYQSYPYFIIPVAFISALGGMLILLLAPFQFAAERNFSWRYSLMNSSDIRKSIAFSDYVRTQHPEFFTVDADIAAGKVQLVAPNAASSEQKLGEIKA